ncbi:MAG: metallophosphoesterase [Treponema sp.]|jgi:predicted phosphodiesterase|nr:metallophosphoesterase [Treponema sp.]
MKILFLHLSDLHIKDDSQINLKVDKIINATQIIDKVEKCILICSGDLAFSGKKEEYKCVSAFFASLLPKLRKSKDHYIELYLVPGNHDMILPSDARTSDNILSYFKQGIEDQYFNLELSSQDNFFYFEKSKKCFVSDKVVDSRIIDVKGYKIQYNLINTAPFSTLRKDNKEIHHLPDSFLFSLVKKDNVNLSITVMHHSTEWFHSKTKEALEKMIRGHSDIVFQGHEHNVRTIQSDGYLLSKGGEFSGAMTHKSTFSILTFDTCSNICEEINFEWNDEKTMFCKTSNERQFTITPKATFLKPNSNFINSFFEDPIKISKNVLDYFVFPKLYHEIKKSQEDSKLLTEEIFWKELSEHKIINISGKSRSGKTTLIKYFFNKCIEKQMLPIYIGSDSHRVKSSVDKIIKYNFDLQYGEEVFLFEKYEQTEINKKILFIDDLDLIKPENSQKILLDVAKDKFSFIVFTSKKRLELDVKHMTKEEIIGDNEYYNINIEDFYKEKRNELINKLCDLNNEIKSELLDNNIMEIIDNLVKRRFGLFELSPEYIVQYVKYFLSKPDDTTKGEAVFNVIFETNIRKAIIDNSPERYVDYCLISLEEIAFSMHKNKNERILYPNIVNIIDEINKNRGLKIDIEKCFGIILSSKIIKKYDDDNSFEFSNRNYLAYFIAKKLNKLIENNGLDILELEYIFKNICFGINDNILLFLSFLRNNTKFALNICELLDSIVREFDELNFDINNIGFINPQHDFSVSIPTQKDKKEMEKRVDDHEKHFRKEENEEIQFRSVYDYNEKDADTLKNRIVRAVKYLEIISKSLISHNVNFELSEKKKIIEQMYSAPNRILYAIFKPHDDQYNEIIDDIYESIKSTDTDEASKLRKQDIEEIFYRSAISICLSLYDHVAYFGSSTDTLYLLNEVDMKTTNYKISNLIMEENGGTTENFVNKAIKLKESKNDLLLSNLIKMVARKHLITRNVDFNIKDKIADKIFTSSSKKQVLSISYKSNKK